jgi:hypothetical protein
MIEEMLVKNLLWCGSKTPHNRPVYTSRGLTAPLASIRLAHYIRTAHSGTFQPAANLRFALWAGLERRISPDVMCNTSLKLL